MQIIFWSHFVVLLKTDLDVQQTHLLGWLVEHKLLLSYTHTCDIIYNNHCYVFGHVLLCILSLTWMFNKPPLRGRFVEQKLPLIYNFMRGQIYYNHCYVFYHTLLCYLSLTWMFNKPTSGASLLNKSSHLPTPLHVTKFKTIIGMFLVTLCCAT